MNEGGVEARNMTASVMRVAERKWCSDESTPEDGVDSEDHWGELESLAYLLNYHFWGEPGQGIGYLRPKGPRSTAASQSLHRACLYHGIQLRPWSYGVQTSNTALLE